MCARLSQISDFQKFIPTFDFRQATLQQPPLETSPKILTTSSSTLSQLSLVERTYEISYQFFTLIKPEDVLIEEMMIANGAALLPAVLPVYPRYCAHTGIAPSIQKIAR